MDILLLLVNHVLLECLRRYPYVYKQNYTKKSKTSTFL